MISLALAASAGQDRAGQDRLVTRPGVVLFDPASAGSGGGPADMDALAARCGSNADYPVPMPIHRLTAPDGYGTDPRAKQLSFAVMTRAAAWAGLSDHLAAEQAVAALHRWARADGLGRLDITRDGRNTKSVYALKVVLMGLVPSWALLAPYGEVDPARRKTIDMWMGELVSAANVPTGGAESRYKSRRCAENEGLPRSPLSNCNNHRYLRDAVAMAWGAYVGDDGLFNQGIERFGIALQQMRPDGSLPLETIRGARALWYQRHALASLTVMAEIAALQGWDLYGMDWRGRSLATGIRFLASAIRDQGLVRDYARANAIPGPSTDWRDQDLGFLKTRSRRHYMAWIGLLKRHPGLSPEGEALFETLDAGLPLIDEYSGGNLSCLARVVAPERF